MTTLCLQLDGSYKTQIIFIYSENNSHYKLLQCALEACESVSRSGDQLSVEVVSIAWSSTPVTQVHMLNVNTNSKSDQL